LVVSESLSVMIERGIYRFKKTSAGRKKNFLWLCWNPRTTALRPRLAPASEGSYTHVPEETVKEEEVSFKEEMKVEPDESGA
jgi:hypothetical protein